MNPFFRPLETRKGLEMSLDMMLDNLIMEHYVFDRCWAEERDDWEHLDERPMRCHAKHVTDIGLCAEHYKEIVGKEL